MPTILARNLTGFYLTFMVSTTSSARTCIPTRCTVATNYATQFPYTTAVATDTFNNIPVARTIFSVSVTAAANVIAVIAVIAFISITLTFHSTSATTPFAKHCTGVIASNTMVIPFATTKSTQF